MIPTLIESRRIADARGWFAETWTADRLAGHGLDARFVQENQSLSRSAGTVRGLHCQVPPFAQAKLVRVARGRVLDVVVDVRRGSPTYGRHVSAALSGETGLQIYVPVGYLHGFVTLEAETEVVYKVTGGYDRASERGVRWDDPVLGIDWGLAGRPAILSPRDAAAAGLAAFDSPFAYDGVPLQLGRIGPA
jgi:dTDP-4-dehydrorhamnose 3,5-epimerase